jgi:pyruvate kinase
MAGDRDRDDLGVDFIGISFLESARHVVAMRELTGGDWPRIFAKIASRPG